MRAWAHLSLALITGASCLPPQEDPTTVADLRVLGISFEPPELQATSCEALRGLGGSTNVNGSLGALTPLLPLLSPVQYRALIADPKGEGRSIRYALSACSSVGDRQCTGENDVVPLASGTTTGGELTLRTDLVMRLAPDGGLPLLRTDAGLDFERTEDGGLPLVTLPDGTQLLQSVLENDPVRGLGGIRVPVVLELDTGEGERIFAQKLMVLGCRFFPQQRPNATPVLPGVTFQGEPWPEDEMREVRGTSSVQLAPVDFSSLEEDYFVPSYALTPVQLRESWKIAWYTDFGTMSPFETGGTNVAGMTGQLGSRWRPGDGREPRVVTFTMMVRDGRGGQSWLQRRVRWSP